MTFTSPSGTSEPIKAFYVDAPLDVDPESGMPIRARRIRAHVHLSALTIGTPVDVLGYWKVSFVNNVGQIVDGVIESPDADRTLNQLSFTVKINEVIS